MKKLLTVAVLALLTVIFAACAPQAQPMTEEPMMEAPMTEETMTEETMTDDTMMDDTMMDDTMMDDTMMMETMLVELSGDQQVPPVMTFGFGSANVALDGNTLTLDGTFEFLESDLMEVAGTPAHIHEAPMGENGPVIFPIEVSMNPDMRSGTLSLTTELDDEQRTAFMAGNFYINIHTVENPGGEIRGQITPAMDGM